MREIDTSNKARHSLVICGDSDYHIMVWLSRGFPYKVGCSKSMVLDFPFRKAPLASLMLKVGCGDDIGETDSQDNRASSIDQGVDQVEAR